MAKNVSLVEAKYVDPKGPTIPTEYGGENYKSRAVEIPNGNGSVISTQIGRLTYRTIENTLMRSYLNKMSIIIFGLPGVGKSDILQKFGRTVQAKDYQEREFVYFNKENDVSRRTEILSNPKKYFFVMDVRTAQLTIDQIKGTPKIGAEKKHAWDEYTRPPWVHLATHPDAAGVLLFDEINQGMHSVLNMMFQTLLDRIIDFDPVSPNVFICGAGNIGAQFTVQDIPIPVLTRAKIAWLEANPAEWYHWAKSINPKDNLPYVDPVILHYVQSDEKNTFLVVPDSGESGSTQAAFPCPRSIVAFSREFRTINEQYKEYRAKSQRVSPGQWIEEVVEEAAHICGRKWADGFAKFLKHSGTYLVADKLEKQGLSNMSMEEQDTVKVWLEKALLYYGEQVLIEGNTAERVNLLRYLKIATQLPVESLTSMFSAIKSREPKLFGGLTAEAYGLKDPEMTKALNHVAGIR